MQESVEVSSAQDTHTVLSLEEDKLTRIKLNMLLCEYYQQRGQFPQKYLHELQNLAYQAIGVQVEAAPQCSIAPDGSQVVLGDWTAPVGSGA